MDEGTASRKLIPAPKLLEWLAITDMTLWRWINDPALRFPQPIRINRRRFWRESDIAAWLDQRVIAA
ncbi:AlpA family transcriptional regulator [Cypionkella sp.]|uniref:helix-turn-helix transcriptional regulator n=1 Tax=Cypionkella sp. TaxID=2811411 RepID=UPI0027295D93|nr:transcriptional regulator [Cypionkella sp.]